MMGEGRRWPRKRKATQGAAARRGKSNLGSPDFYRAHPSVYMVYIDDVETPINGL